MWSPDLYQRALDLAARAHHGQKLPGTDLPYLVHPVAVAAEALGAAVAEGGRDLDLVAGCALLHDVIEDCGVQHADLARQLGAPIADGVLALSKDPALPKALAMERSLEQIRAQPREVWMVKLADRIANLRAPPGHWSAERRAGYRDEARLILRQLGDASPALARRLLARIEAYGAWCSPGDRA